jgi:two-component system cell cycle response regulator CtrA
MACKCAKLLESKNESLRGQSSQLEQAIGIAAEPPVMFGLTKSEATTFGVLLSTRLPRRETFMLALFSDRVDDAPDQKIIDVFICKLRKKLKPYGIDVETK